MPDNFRRCPMINSQPASTTRLALRPIPGQLHPDGFGKGAGAGAAAGERLMGCQWPPSPTHRNCLVPERVADRALAMVIPHPRAVRTTLGRNNRGTRANPVCCLAFIQV